jgi:3-oxoacyl-[acyl-carrier-protein] synthase-3
LAILKKVCNFDALMLSAITAIDVFYPDYVLSNKELETMVNTTDEWITSRTGISERRILKDEGKGAAYLGTQAVINLLVNNNIDPLSIDVIICATCTPEYKLPPTSTLITASTGLSKAWAFDINATCTGFIYGLELAKMMVESGKYSRVLLVNTEKMSSIVDYTDRNSCILFGDAASATLIENTDGNYGIVDVQLFSDGTEADKIIVKAGGSAYPINRGTNNKEHFFWQDGKAVFKRAVLEMENSCKSLLERNNMSLSSINYIVAHQANKRILDALKERISIGDEKMLENIQYFGNTSSVSIPLCLFENRNKLKRGDKILLTAFGSGYTWGSALVSWNC